MMADPAVQMAQENIYGMQGNFVVSGVPYGKMNLNHNPHNHPSKLGASYSTQDFLSMNKNATPNKIQMNYIMKTIAHQFPGTLNLLRNLANTIEAELNAAQYAQHHHYNEASLDINMRRLELNSNAGGQSGKMSVEMSRDKTSPNLDLAVRQGGLVAQVSQRLGAHNTSFNQLQKLGRVRRSYSMVASLDKLTSKLKSNTLLDLAGGDKKQGVGETMVDTTPENKSNYVRPPTNSRQSIQKRFVAEVTQEVLIVSDEGCYISRTDQTTGVTFLHKLNDIKEVLEVQTSQLLNMVTSP